MKLSKDTRPMGRIRCFPAHAIAALLMIALAAASAYPEVSVTIHDKGEYIKFFNSSEVLYQQPQIWARIYTSGIRLNEWGDLYGDLAPAYDFVTDQKDAPFVVWPYKTTNGDYDLAYSWFNPATLRWARTILINPEPNYTDEINPQIAYCGTSVHLAYESLGPMSKVFYCRFRDGIWEEPIRLSRPDAWGRLKSVVCDGATVEVEIEEQMIIRVGPVFRMGKVVVKTYSFPSNPMVSQ